ncbi:MAG TPA: L,D-transpeptidase [Solirubrobacteraceae bacterium]|jgi:lipoprotein-anchoring transpeptidase ErfK/SrfK|nr:L,D-transpeptidase [Solirubrobacteraceae bacterium]
MARLAVAACLLGFGAWCQTALGAGRSRVAAQQQVVVLLAGHGVRDAPTGASRTIAFVAATRPITGERTALPVLAQAVDRRGRFWLRVRLPGRAVGGQRVPATGWISATQAQLATTSWHIVVDLGARRALIYREGIEVRSYPAIVGKPSTPTPTGQYFVEENVSLAASAPGAPFALATSDRSNVLQEFDGGPGQIALHGLDNLGGRLGTAVSHGCIRLADAAITWLAAHIRAGVPITIVEHG